MAAEQTVQTLAALTVIGSVVFVLLMWFNIASLMKYLRRDKTVEADEKKQHSGLFWQWTASSPSCFHWTSYRC